MVRWLPIVLLLVSLVARDAQAAGQLSQRQLATAAASIRAEQLEKHCYTLADDALEGRRAGTRGGRTAANYLRNHLARWGYQGAGQDGDYYQLFQNGYRNVLALLPGSDPKLKDQVVLLGAHYDHVGYGSPRTSLGPIGYIHNGADDNASGTAVVLEVARALAQLPRRPRRSVLIAFWDAEELGLLGSEHWCRHPTVPLRRIKAAVNCDMLGRLRPQGLQVLAWRSGGSWRRLVLWSNHQVGLPLRFSWELKRNSDHYPLLEHDVPVVMFHTGLHDDYHRPSDDPDKLNYPGMERIARLVFLTTVQLAQADRLPRFRSQVFEETGTPASDHGPGTQAASPRLGLSWRSQNHSENDEPGALVLEVTPGLPAWQAGLRPGCRITGAAGRELRRPDELFALVQRCRRKLLLRWLDAEGNPQQRIVILRGKPFRIGITWRADPLDPQVMVLVRVIADSPAARAGLRRGDRIYGVDGRPITSFEEFSRQVREARDRLELLVERQGRLVPVVVRPWSLFDLEEQLRRVLPLVAPAPRKVNPPAASAL